MSNEYAGVVEQIKSEKINSTKTGKAYTVYKLVTKEGEVFNCGFNAPKDVEVGKSYLIKYTNGKFGKDYVSATLNNGEEGGPVKSTTYQKKQDSQADWAFPISPTNYNRAVCRREAVKDAIQFYAEISSGVAELDNEGRIDAVICLAKRFEAYTTGDEDVAAVKKAAAEYKSMVTNSHILINDDSIETDW